MEENIMAVKKVSTKPEETKKDVAVEVETPTVVDAPEVEVEAPVVEETEVATTDGVDENANAPEVEVPEVEVETPATKDVEVDTESAKVNNRPSGNVKIRMRVDHKCCIAMERYDLKAGKTYVVPENVKRILNKAGLLAPL